MNWIPLLLADPSPCLRLLVLKDLLHKPESDLEVKELIEVRDSDFLITDFIKLQQPDGSWKGTDFANMFTYTDKITATSMVLLRVGFLGYSLDHPSVQKGVKFLFSKQSDEGSWPISQTSQKVDGGYDMIPLQTAFPLRAIAACGFSTNDEAELSYEWLLAQRLKDGSWPAGTKAGTRGFIAGYRKLAHSQWGCRTNTTAALHCLALHPQYRTGEEARRALDLLLARETREKHTLGFEVTRLIGLELATGYFTHFAKFDVAFLLHLCWRIGASTEDERVRELLEFILQQQGPYGLWNYSSFPQASRWVTFDILRSLTGLDASTDWLSLEPRTPFRAYPRREKRF
ncbi:MAG: prenyltransferase/squalene oxidase repeat-containing protein [Candidatus Hodarchaeota archaeon]